MARLGYGEFEFISLKEGILAPLNFNHGEMITVKILLIFNFSKESSQCIFIQNVQILITALKKCEDSAACI